MKELPDRWRDLGEFIREQRAISRLSLRRLSDLAGISNPYLSQIERGLRKPSAEILQSIARALRISAETLYERAGLLEVREGGADTATAILRDPDLSEDAKQTLIKVYLSLRSPVDRRPAPPADAGAATSGDMAGPEPEPGPRPGSWPDLAGPDPAGANRAGPDLAGPEPDPASAQPEPARLSAAVRPSKRPPTEAFPDAQ